MKIIRTEERAFEEAFRRIRQRGTLFDDQLWTVVRGIVDDVAARGDEALFRYTEKFDGAVLDAARVEVSPGEMDEAIARVSKEDREILKLAAGRIERFHVKQVRESWSSSDEEGIELGQRVTPLERIGIYAPGGLAAYPSTVLMAAIPARIAGVKQIILVSPDREGGVKPLIAAAARIAGVTRIFKIGGAQAVAALAFGTESVPKVDKIVGPGNAYVAAAKKLVYGQVAIDMIAGPSEVVVIADAKADAAAVAADLLAQAEHDAMASAVLLTPSGDLAARVLSAVEQQLERLPKKAIAARSLEEFGALILTRDMEEAAAIADRFAPEHLELMVENPRAVLERVRHAGAIFLGYSTPEAVGDYIAGPNHILPTGGTARFSSPLGVYDFIKRTSVLRFSPQALQRYGRQGERFARMEGLDGHGESIAVRLDQK